MKTLIKILALTAVASILMGFGYAYSRANEVKTETRVFCVRAVAGDTIEEIIGEFYNPNTEKMSWDEWRDKQMTLNNNIRFNTDGSPRHLQIGDRVHIIAKVKVVK